MVGVFIAIPNPITESPTDPVPGSCTIFSASMGNTVLYGNNEDYYKSETYLWTEVATEENYGCLYLGFKDYSHQGGINEKGLCFDANALPKTSIHLAPDLQSPPRYEPPYNEHMMWLPVLILRKAATVQEAIAIAKTYQRENWYPIDGKVSYQLNFADATGDAVVMSVDAKGELAFTHKKPGEKFLLSTNFNKANPDNALEYPCERYNTAEKMLSSIEKEEELTVEYVTSMLAAVHQKNLFSRTLYSNVFDLKNRVLYLYHRHQFDEVAVLNLDEELAKEEYLIPIEELFSQETRDSARNEFVASIAWLCAQIIFGTGILIVLIHFLKKIRLKGKDNRT